jgi:peptidoglycan/xylan/chitin deacetylase (PgdA/CDA1 family)
LGDVVSLVRKQPGVCILVYHRILEVNDPLLDTEPDIAAFTWQMETLARCFNVLSLPDATMAIRAGRVPPRAVCISFDDGYRSTHDLALPILNRLGLPATVFVTSGYLDGGNMWNDRIVEAVRGLPEGFLDLQCVNIGVYQLSGIVDRKNVVNSINDDCKYLLPQRRFDVIEELERRAGQMSRCDLMLTRDMVKNLAGHGIEIGGHTVTHPILTKLDDNAACDEIIKNKQVLESIIDGPLRLFAYPNGKVGMDFDERHVQMVQAAGYIAAFTTATGAATIKDEIFQLPRSRPWDMTPLRFSMRILLWLARSSAKMGQSNNYSTKAAAGNVHL